jgi:hypothetical protein
VTASSGYVVVDSWTAVRDWRRAHPHRPFVGIRVDDPEIWIAVEPKTSSGPLPGPLVAAIERIFQSGLDEPWVDDGIVLQEARTLREAHQLARRVVAVIRSFESAATAPGNGWLGTCC